MRKLLVLFQNHPPLANLLLGIDKTGKWKNTIGAKTT